MFLVGKAFRPLSRTIFFAIRFSPIREKVCKSSSFSSQHFPPGQEEKRRKVLWGERGRPTPTPFIGGTHLAPWVGPSPQFPVHTHTAAFTKKRAFVVFSFLSEEPIIYHLQHAVSCTGMFCFFPFLPSFLRLKTFCSIFQKTGNFSKKRPCNYLGVRGDEANFYFPCLGAEMEFEAFFEMLLRDRRPLFAAASPLPFSRMRSIIALHDFPIYSFPPFFPSFPSAPWDERVGAKKTRTDHF